MAYFNHTYGYIANPREIQDYLLAMHTYYEGFDPDDLHRVAESDFRAFLAREYVRCGEVNTNNNDRKSGFVHLANAFIVASLVTLVISLLPFFVTYYSQPKIQKIQIVDGGGDHRGGQAKASTEEPDTEPSPKAGESPEGETSATFKSLPEGESGSSEEKVKQSGHSVEATK